ncbi:MAG: tetratricopeptide repeat protein [Pseudomonadota bacterium]
MRANFAIHAFDRFAAAGIAAAVLATAPVPVLAQDDNSEARLRKVEAEVRALQRQVFPGGDSRFFEPQISTAGNSPRSTVSTPSTTAVTDILARLDALEIQMQQLTAQGEVNANAIAQMETRLAALEAGGVTEAPADVVEEAPEQADISTIFDPDPVVAEGPSAERVAAVQQITKPQSDDEGDDEYSYGFRLWNAGFYPEARQQLSSFVNDYPSHWRVTYGRNLLGRAYLDDGNADEAARWFLRNYQADNTAARAPDSLLFLAEAMIAKNDTSRACIALSEFARTYPAIATGRLSNQYETNLQNVSCD